MPVLSLLIPARDESRVAIEACKYGVEADLIERDTDGVYVDLYGSSDKMAFVASRVNARVITEVPFVDREMKRYS